MVPSTTAAFVLGILGSFSSLIFFLSPVPTFVEIWLRRSVEQYSAALYLATLIDCMASALYGLPIVQPKSTVVAITNGLGTAYVIFFLIFSERRKRLQVLLIVLFELIFVAVLTILVLTLTHETKKRTEIVGITCICLSIMMQASPLSAMKMAITTRNLKFMPLLPYLASFAKCITWTTYALIRLDLFILILNVVCTLFSLVQLILYVLYYKSTQKQIAVRQQNYEVGLSEAVMN